MTWHGTPVGGGCGPSLPGTLSTTLVHQQKRGPFEREAENVDDAVEDEEEEMVEGEEEIEGKGEQPGMLVF